MQVIRANEKHVNAQRVNLIVVCSKQTTVNIYIRQNIRNLF